MKSLILFLALSAQAGWAMGKDFEQAKQEYEEREARSRGSNFYSSATVKLNTFMSEPYEKHGWILVYTTHTVVRSNHLGQPEQISFSWENHITLDAFIASGLLCDFRGKHEWFHARPSQRCAERPEWSVWGESCVNCGRCRRKIQKTKTVSEWED